MHDQRTGRTVRIAFHTLGCRLNQYDTEVMKSRLPADWRCDVVPWEEDADVFVLNSCTVTLRADQKARKLVRTIKRRCPQARVVVTGCYAQTQPAALAAVPEIDGVFGVSEREDIAEWLPRVLAGDRPVEVGAFSKRHEFSSHDIASFLGENPGLRFRLSSIHPHEVRDPLLALFRRHANLQPYLHVSMQSGADTVLRRMRRPYDAASVRDAVLAAAAVAPDFGIGADVIVGYPGETDAEFDETAALVETLPFSYLHVFRYSPRPGTPAAGQTPVHTETITARSRRLRELSLAKREAFESRLLDREIAAVVESDRPAIGWVQATTGNYATIQVPDRWEQGSVVRCRPETFHEGVLRSPAATLLEPPRRSAT